MSACGNKCGFSTELDYIGFLVKVKLYIYWIKPAHRKQSDRAKAEQGLRNTKYLLFWQPAWIWKNWGLALTWQSHVTHVALGPSKSWRAWLTWKPLISFWAWASTKWWVLGTWKIMDYIADRWFVSMGYLQDCYLVLQVIPAAHLSLVDQDLLGDQRHLSGLAVR